MGCSASKNLIVEQIENEQEIQPNGEAYTIRNISSDIMPTQSEDPEEEYLENSNVNNIQKGANGMSFDIVFHNNEHQDGNIIQRHPPKRILELKENEGSPAITLEKLQEKLEEAEIRRQQILQQRVQSASLKSKFRNQDSVDMTSDNDHEESMRYLKIPPEETPHPPNPYDVSYV